MDLRVARLGQIDRLRAFRLPFFGGFDVRLATSICVRSASALASLAAATRRASAASRDRVTSCDRRKATASSLNRLVNA